MELFSAIESRHMCRDFDPLKLVPEEVIDKIINAGKKAPSAGGLEDQRFTVVKDENEKKALTDAALGQDQINDAPVVIVVSSEVDIVEAKYGERGRDLYAPQNVAVAVENMLLAATALDLGACWVGSFNENKVKEILKLPENYRPMVIVPIGFKK